MKKIPDWLPDWLPDWKNDDAYYKTTLRRTTESTDNIDTWKTPKRYWAWEFLRRNEKYQTAYSNLSSILEYKGLSSHKIYNGIPVYAGKKGFPPDIQKELHLVSIQFGFNLFVPDPSIPFRDVPNAAWRTGLTDTFHPTETGIITNTVLSHGEILWRFNVNLPIEPQIKEAKRCLKQFKELNHIDGSQALKYRGNSFPLYLRILDARARGATYDEIANYLYPDTPNEYPDYTGRDAVKKATKEALRLLEGGYMLLID